MSVIDSWADCQRPEGKASVFIMVIFCVYCVQTKLRLYPKNQVTSALGDIYLYV